MSRNVYDILKERGLIAQVTHEQEIRELLGKEKVSFYIGFDPTADSLARRSFYAAGSNETYAERRSSPHSSLVAAVRDYDRRSEREERTCVQMMTQEIIQQNCERFQKAAVQSLLIFRTERQ